MMNLLVRVAEFNRLIKDKGLRKYGKYLKKKKQFKNYKRTGIFSTCNYLFAFIIHVQPFERYQQTVAVTTVEFQ